MTTAANTPAPERQYTVAEFLETIPPNQVCKISDLVFTLQDGTTPWFILRRSQLALHCTDDKCNGVRFFRCVDSDKYDLPTDGFRDMYIRYVCSNCRNTTKTFSVSAQMEADRKTGLVLKYGEFPPFGPPTPARLIKLVGPDREVFLKGRRCENQGLGIGAAIYYRRVVEHQKNRILEEIKKVSEKIGAKPATIALLDKAISETRFSSAMEIAKDALPESLLINGHNPLSLLHSALSEGVHEMSDEDCLEQAESIRVVLGELSERLGQALKDEAELVRALDKLINRGSKTKSKA